MTAGLLQQEYSSCAVCTQGCPYFTSVSHLQWSGLSSTIILGNSSKGWKLLLDDFRQLGIHNWHHKPHFWHLFGPLDDWSCDFRFFSKQLVAPSIGMLVYSFQIHFSSYWISSLFQQFIFFISALALSPLFDANLCHIWGCFCNLV